LELYNIRKFNYIAVYCTC